MTDIEITPALLREVSVWLRGSFVGPEPGKALEAVADRLEREQNQLVEDLLAPRRPTTKVDDSELLALVQSLTEIAADHFEGLAAESLDDWADTIERRIERERAESTRIDELAKIFHDAATGRVEPGQSTWHLLTQLRHDEYRAGIRAVLSCLEDRSADADSESCTKPETPQVTPRAREPRRWHDLHDVPADVAIVTDVDGRIIARPARGWCAYISNPDFAPWTEVIADA